MKKQQCFLLSLLVTVSLVLPCFGKNMVGITAPDFTLKDVYGKQHSLAAISDQALIVMYFFSIDSQASLDGLHAIAALKRQYVQSDLTVWGISRAEREEVSDYVLTNGITFPVFPDEGEVSDLYDAGLILPVTCIIGPEMKIIDYFQGGGRGTEEMLLRLAQRELQRNQLPLAKAIGKEVQKENPDNVEAESIQGYAALKEEKYDEAERIFQTLAAGGPDAEIIGKEGLAAVYAKKGEANNALKVIKDVEEKAPERGYVHLLKGDILYARDEKQEAAAAYEKAVLAPEAYPHQKSVAYNQLGRLETERGNYNRARELYDRAIDIDPYYIEAMSNKGVAHQKEGNWNKALLDFKRAMKMNAHDPFTEVLASKAQEMVALQRDKARRERVDTLVKELAARFREQQTTSVGSGDSWTSGPMILSFMDFQEKGALTQRDGVSLVLTGRLTDELNATGRLQVVERMVLDSLMDELNLGSSELADPAVSLKLGRILAAKIMATGSLMNLPDSTLLSLRLIDTETTGVAKVLTRRLPTDSIALVKEFDGLYREVLETIMHRYPLRGFIVEPSGERVLINLGLEQGVVLGTKFAVLGEPTSITYKGKVMKGAAPRVGELEVIEVEEQFCTARVVSAQKDLHQDDKVEEIYEKVIVPEEGGNARSNI